MNIVMFYHSLLSDWNHGNAHFLRGIVTELICRGETVKVFEPQNSWSLNNLMTEYGENALHEFHTYYPGLNSTRYNPATLNLRKELKDADLVIVHEWNDPWLVKEIGRLKPSMKFVLLFHDTHHRIVTDFDSMSKYNLKNYDGVLAFGRIIKKIYLDKKLAKKAWAWHEAADIRLFHPMNKTKNPDDVVWIGNWGDEERTSEIYEFLINPVKELGLTCRVYGVRYPAEAIKKLEKAGIEYCGWLPNFKVPEIFSQFKMTVHIPRKPYVQLLPGIPTIRPFEALACGIPLISARWNDDEGLFNSGRDFMLVNNGEEMSYSIKELLSDSNEAAELSRNGLQSIYAKHTCAHRVNELYGIYNEVRAAEKIKSTPLRRTIKIK